MSILPDDEIPVESYLANLGITAVHIVELCDAVADNIPKCFLDSGETHVETVAIRIQVMVDAFPDLSDIIPSSDTHIVPENLFLMVL